MTTKRKLSDLTAITSVANDDLTQISQLADGSYTSKKITMEDLNSSFYVSKLLDGAKHESNYTTVNSNSANWENTYSVVNSNSANWENTYSVVNSNSAEWGTTISLPQSSNWDSVYNTVNSNSADWNTESNYLSALLDTSISNPTSGQVLKFNGTDWINSAIDSDASLVEDGYVQFTNGLVVQWGTADAAGSINFNLTFPNACFGVVGTINSSSTSPASDQEIRIASISTTAFSYNVIGGSLAIYWMAVGN